MSADVSIFFLWFVVADQVLSLLHPRTVFTHTVFSENYELKIVQVEGWPDRRESAFRQDSAQPPDPLQRVSTR